jgi:hypothetical protein
MHNPDQGGTDKPSTAARLNRAFGPVAAGLVIDMLDLATFGPIGLFIGLPIGALMGYWMGQSLGLEPKARGWCALAAGIYCLVPVTEFLPLATLLGAYVRYRSSSPKNEKELDSSE